MISSPLKTSPLNVVDSVLHYMSREETFLTQTIADGSSSSGTNIHWENEVFGSLQATILERQWSSLSAYVHTSSQLGHFWVTLGKEHGYIFNRFCVAYGKILVGRCVRKQAWILKHSPPRASHLSWMRWFSSLTNGGQTPAAAAVTVALCPDLALVLGKEARSSLIYPNWLLPQTWLESLLGPLFAFCPFPFQEYSALFTCRKQGWWSFSTVELITPDPPVFF